jgi:hypothetical protein
MGVSFYLFPILFYMQNIFVTIGVFSLSILIFVPVVSAREMAYSLETVQAQGQCPRTPYKTPIKRFNTGQSARTCGFPSSRSNARSKLTRAYMTKSMDVASIKDQQRLRKTLLSRPEYRQKRSGRVIRALAISQRQNKGQ